MSWGWIFQKKANLCINLFNANIIQELFEPKRFTMKHYNLKIETIAILFQTNKIIVLSYSPSLNSRPQSFRVSHFESNFNQSTLLIIRRKMECKGQVFWRWLYDHIIKESSHYQQTLTISTVYRFFHRYFNLRLKKRRLIYA